MGHCRTARRAKGCPRRLVPPGSATTAARAAAGSPTFKGEAPHAGRLTSKALRENGFGGPRRGPDPGAPGAA